MSEAAGRRLDPQPWMTAPESVALVAALTRDGAEVRYVGGCVRDAVLGRPVKDVDLATDAPPEAVVRLLEAAGVRAVPTGFEHGTVTAVVDGRPYEVTTLRRDVETDGRRAVVAFGTDWREDAARRDFTMNAMSLAPDGTLYDYFGGVEDARAGLVRFIGDPERRIREDMLRILRFYRFHAHYGRGEPDPDGLAACAALAGSLPGLSAERVRNELLRLLEAPAPGATVALMCAHGALSHWLPEAGSTARLDALVRLEARHAQPDTIRRLAALLPADAVVAAAVGERLRLSNAAAARLCAALDLARGDAPNPVHATLYRRGAETVLDAALWRLAGDSESDSWSDALAGAKNWTPVAFPLRGQDLLELGVPPGPSVGEIMRAVEDWWVAEAFAPDRAACLDRARSAAVQRRAAANAAPARPPSQDAP